MLSAETASGRHPVEAVRVMSRVISHTESDAHYRAAIDGSRSDPPSTTSDAIGFAMRHVTDLLGAAATVAFTGSGHSALRMARERVSAPLIGVTPREDVARRLTLAWGVHPVVCGDVCGTADITELAGRTVKAQGFGATGQNIVISAGMPFGVSGSTNLLRIAEIG
jgi:pyruvate kinase